MKQKFYICSYGGCGTLMLRNALLQLGNHTNVVHSRVPPEKLEYVDKVGFNGKAVPEEELKNITVIYIFKDPLKSINSRYKAGRLLEILGQKYTLDDVVREKKDLFRLEEFFDNYTTPNPNRNYKIICLKYEDIFDKKDEVAKVLGIDELSIRRRETQRQPLVDHKLLEEIYKNLNEKINKMGSITII